MNKVKRIVKGLSLMLNHFKNNLKANKMER